MKIELDKKRTHRIRDYVLYLAISFAFVGLIFFFALSSHVDQVKFEKWLLFAFYTPVIFGFVIEQNRLLWKQRSFRILLGFCLLLHCIALAVILAHTKKIKAVSFLPGFAEIVLLQRLTRWLIRPTPSPQ